jgi:hypothetical protein
MSDNLDKKYPTGNSVGSPTLPGHRDTTISSISSFPFGRRLAEECFVFAMAELRSIYKRRDLLRLADTYQPVTFRLGGQPFALHLITEFLPRPRHLRRTGEEMIRIWMTCPACFRRVRKVYTFCIEPGSPILADLKCYHCHGLTYLSKNCSGNRWWHDFAMPMKRLLRRQQRLLLRHSLRSMAQLEQIEQSIWMLRERAAVRKRPHKGIPHHARRKRPYRDIALIQ